MHSKIKCRIFADAECIKSKRCWNNQSTKSRVQTPAPLWRSVRRCLVTINFGVKRSYGPRLKNCFWWLFNDAPHHPIKFPPKWDFSSIIHQPRIRHLFLVLFLSSCFPRPVRLVDGTASCAALFGLRKYLLSGKRAYLRQVLSMDSGGLPTRHFYVSSLPCHQGCLVEVKPRCRECQALLGAGPATL